MEQLIIFVILAIVSLFLEKEKGRREPDERSNKAVHGNRRVPDSPQSKLKEMSKDLYRELQKEMQRTDVEPPSRQLHSRCPQRPVVVAAQPVVDL